jgi:hypothetical protein
MEPETRPKLVWAASGYREIMAEQTTKTAERRPRENTFMVMTPECNLADGSHQGSVTDA